MENMKLTFHYSELWGFRNTFPNLNYVVISASTTNYFFSGILYHDLINITDLAGLRFTWTYEILDKKDCISSALATQMLKGIF